MMTRLKQEQKEDLNKEVMVHMSQRNRKRIHRLKRRNKEVYPFTENFDDAVSHILDVYEALPEDKRVT